MEKSFGLCISKCIFSFFPCLKHPPVFTRRTRWGSWEKWKGLLQDWVGSPEFLTLKLIHICPLSVCQNYHFRVPPSFWLQQILLLLSWSRLWCPVSPSLLISGWRFVLWLPLSIHVWAETQSPFAHYLIWLSFFSWFVRILYVLWIIAPYQVTFVIGNIQFLFLKVSWSFVFNETHDVVGRLADD